jgi:hypothetical protein
MTNKRVVYWDCQYRLNDPDTSETTTLPYEWVDRIVEDKIAVRRNGKYGFIDLNGNVVVPLIYDWVGNFCEGRVDVYQNRKYGVINKTGGEVIPCWYDDITCASDSTFDAYITIATGRQVCRFDRDGILLETDEPS